MFDQGRNQVSQQSLSMRRLAAKVTEIASTSGHGEEDSMVLLLSRRSEVAFFS